MRLIFMRHGESEYNLRGLCNADPAMPVGLTPRGRQQAKDAARRWRHTPIRRIYVSRLQRAHETAAIACGGHCAPICVDARLDDRRTGFEGRSVQTYLQTMAAAPDPFAWKAEGGESYREMVARVQDFINELRSVDEPVALVVTHHEVIQAVSGIFLGLDWQAMWQVWVDHGATVEFDTRDL